MTVLSAVVALPVSSAGAQGNVLVTFDAEVNGFNPGPLTGGTMFSGQFTLDRSVVPDVVGRFAEALDNFSFTIGGQTFGGTNGRYQQFTSANGASGFMAGALGDAGFGTFGTTNGSFSDGSATWNFVGMSFDWRGAAASIFPGGNPALIGSGFGRSDDGITANDEIDYALMSLRFVNAADGTLSEALRVSFSRIDFVEPSASVPEPATLALLTVGLLAIGGRHRARRRSARPCDAESARDRGRPVAGRVTLSA